MYDFAPFKLTVMELQQALLTPELNQNK